MLKRQENEKKLYILKSENSQINKCLLIYLWQTFIILQNKPSASENAGQNEIEGPCMKVKSGKHWKK